MKLICITLLAIVAIAAASVPQISPSFTVTETDEINIHQGDYKVINGATCCNTKGTCKVQSEVQAGKNYMDATNNQTRFDPFGSPQSMVTMYKINKQMVVQNNTCQEYCPLERGDSFEPLAIDPSATKVASKVFNGVTCEGFQWKETIGGVVVMEIITMYVDTSKSPAVPCAQDNILTPFGEKLGTESSTYQQFTAGVPAASLFDIKGIDSCEMSKKCNDNNSDFAKMRRGYLRSLLN